MSSDETESVVLNYAAGASARRRRPFLLIGAILITALVVLVASFRAVGRIAGYCTGCGELVCGIGVSTSEPNTPISLICWREDGGTNWNTRLPFASRTHRHSYIFSNADVRDLEADLRLKQGLQDLSTVLSRAKVGKFGDRQRPLSMTEFLECLSHTSLANRQQRPP